MVLNPLQDESREPWPLTSLKSSQSEWQWLNSPSISLGSCCLSMYCCRTAVPLTVWLWRDHKGRTEKEAPVRKKCGETKTKAPQFRSRCSLFSLGGAFAVKRASCVIVALQNQYCTVMEKHMMPFKFLWDFSFFFFYFQQTCKTTTGSSSSWSWSCFWRAVVSHRQSNLTTAPRKERKKEKEDIPLLLFWTAPRRGVLSRHLPARRSTAQLARSPRACEGSAHRLRLVPTAQRHGQRARWTGKSESSAAVQMRKMTQVMKETSECYFPGSSCACALRVWKQKVYLHPGSMFLWNPAI